VKSIADDLYDPRKGAPAIRTQRLEPGRRPFEPARTNYFSVYLIDTGSGAVWADAAQFSFAARSLLFFVPYQRIRFVPETPLQVTVVQFHANFLCVETFHAEVGCSGILFNDPYGTPVVTLDRSAHSEVAAIVEQLCEEDAGRDLAWSEAMLAHLKVLLIVATRLKASADNACGSRSELQHPLLAELRELIEQNYCRLHSPADYARQLHVTAKTLGRIVREHMGTTPTDLIRNRILIHAKWELLHTLKPVKEIARELGFPDELYFSRLFKKASGHSPKFFREFETEIRGGSNLSMLSAHAPILSRGLRSDT